MESTESVTVRPDGKIVVSAFVPASDWESLRTVAREHDRSLSAEVRTAIRRYLADHASSRALALTA